jgi:hypothetical protein
MPSFRLHRSGGTPLNPGGNINRFPNPNCSEDGLHEQGTSKNDKTAMA